MKTPLIVCLGCLLFAGHSLAEPRTFTNKEGKTMTAELIAVEKEDAVLKLANASRVKVPLASLSEADQEFVKSWWEENKNNVTEMDVRLKIEKKTKEISNSERDKSKDKKKGPQKKVSVDKVVFTCVLNSYTRRDLTDITAEYTIYKRVSTRGKDGSDTNTTTVDGSEKIASLLSNQSVTFETTDVTCENSSEKGSKDKPASSKRETVIGILIKLSANGKEFLQQGYPDNFSDRLKEEEEREADE